jgi:hypothetical protein
MSSTERVILPTRREVGAEELPKEDCEDEQEWLIEIEELSYLILWDYEKLGTATYFSTPKTTIPACPRTP